VYNVRVNLSAERELAAIADGEEKQQVNDLLSSLEETPFPFGVIKLDPPDAYAQICGRFYITYIVDAGSDSVVVFSIRENPERRSF
jgi:hypothetical protein